VGRKLVLDVDTGSDDAVAIMFAALHPDLDLLGVTTVNGNVPLVHTTDNSLRVLDFIGRSDVAVHPGLARPIVRHGFPAPKRFSRDSDRDMHGTELPLPPPVSKAHELGAAEYLVRTVRAMPGEVTLVPVGPLSNIAAALALAPDMVELVPEVVIMGGAHHFGNETPAAEFNIWADPEAADMVLSAGFAKVTLVPLDATHKALVSTADVERLRALGTPAGEAAAKLVEKRIAAYAVAGEAARLDAAPVHDALCTAYLVRPEVIGTRPVHVTVETRGDRTVGRTVMDLRSGSTTPPNCDVAFDADAALFNQLLLTVFARTAQS
jgi:purine nucleosidase/ribosylpyrimidine nucleosidase